MPNEVNSTNGLRLSKADEDVEAGPINEVGLPELVESAEKLSKSANPAGRRRLKIAAGAFTALVVLIVAGYFVWNAFQFENTDDAQIDGHVMPLSARINGQVQTVNFVEGQLVHTGDVLLTIDPADYRVAVAQAQANLADAKATASNSHLNVPITSVSAQSNLDSANTAVVNAEAGVAAAEHNLESAKAATQQAEANAAKSDADLVRYRQLVTKDDISHQQYDQAEAAAVGNRAAVLSAKAEVLASEQVLRQAQGKLLQAKADLRNAQTAPQQVSATRAKAAADVAAVLQHKAQLDQAELNLGYTIIRSPVTGIAGKKSVEVGQNVSPGQELLEVVPLDDIWVTANFKETQLEHMQVGQPVRVKVDAYSRAWNGRVANLGGGTGSVFSLLPPENATGNYVKVVQRVAVRIEFDRIGGEGFNADGQLKPGLSVEPYVRVR